MKNWKSVLGNLAPAVAAAFGGPLAGTATKFLADKLLGKPDADQTEVEAAILGATPDDLAKLRELDNEFRIAMSKLDIDIFALEVEDRKSARDMAKDNMWPQIVLSVLFLGGYFALVFMLFSGEVELTEQNQQMGQILLGVITGAVPSILQFWFGSSHGSKSKTAALSNKP